MKKYFSTPDKFAGDYVTLDEIDSLKKNIMVVAGYQDMKKFLLVVCYKNKNSDTFGQTAFMIGEKNPEVFFKRWKKDFQENLKDVEWIMSRDKIPDEYEGIITKYYK